MMQAMADRAAEFVQKLKEAGVRVTSDCRDNYTPGWKYNHWELKVSPPPPPLLFPPPFHWPVPDRRLG